MESSYRNSNSDVLWKHVLGKVFSGQLSGGASLFSSSFFPGRWGKIVIHAQDLRILKSLGFEDP